MGPEAKVVVKIRAWLSKQPKCFCFKVHGGPSQVRGLCDIICCYKGLFVGFEVKAPGKENNVSKYQELTIQRIQAAGGQAFVVSSLFEVKEIINNL